MRDKDNSIDAAIGARLRQRRNELRLSQRALGDMIGVTYQQIQKYESGKDHIKAAQLRTLADGLSAPLSYFLTVPRAATPANAPGFAEATPAFQEADPLATAQGRELLRSFFDIRSPELRLAVVELARRLAAAQR